MRRYAGILTGAAVPLTDELATRWICANSEAPEAANQGLWYFASQIAASEVKLRRALADEQYASEITKRYVRQLEDAVTAWRGVRLKPGCARLRAGRDHERGSDQCCGGARWRGGWAAARPKRRVPQAAAVGAAQSVAELLAAGEAMRRHAASRIGDRYKVSVRAGTADGLLADLGRLTRAMEAARTVYPAAYWWRCGLHRAVGRDQPGLDPVEDAHERLASWAASAACRRLPGIGGSIWLPA